VSRFSGVTIIKRRTYIEQTTGGINSGTHGAFANILLCGRTVAKNETVQIFFSLAFWKDAAGAMSKITAERLFKIDSLR
jgi:hypothetical protein